MALLLDSRQTWQTLTFIFVAIVVLAVFYLLGSLSLKILGGLFVAMGLLLYFVFPAHMMYQKSHHTNLGQNLGLILLAAGILLLIIG